MNGSTNIEAKYQAYQQQHNLRSSKRRDFIFKHILTISGHFTIDQIYQHIAKIDPDIGIATVYRAIKLFVDANILIEHRFGDKKGFYEINQENFQEHGHLICRQCGKIVEYPIPEIKEIQQKKEREFNFKIDSFKVEFFGICRECLEKQKK
ncbi:hypothetical protein B6D60_06105 [candidate division KSB1 bacterium 4484_87]|nr:MAG: hypothetical protein B6D60_06105 [candidate division KSB1 bacterium 4484_87]